MSPFWSSSPPQMPPRGNPPDLLQRARPTGPPPAGGVQPGAGARSTEGESDGDAFSPKDCPLAARDPPRHRGLPLPRSSRFPLTAGAVDRCVSVRISIHGLPPQHTEAQHHCHSLSSSHLGCIAPLCRRSPDCSDPFLQKRPEARDRRGGCLPFSGLPLQRWRRRVSPERHGSDHPRLTRITGGIDQGAGLAETYLVFPRRISSSRPWRTGQRTSL